MEQSACRWERYTAASCWHQSGCSTYGSSHSPLVWKFPPFSSHTSLAGNPTALSLFSTASLFWPNTCRTERSGWLVSQGQVSASQPASHLLSSFLTTSLCWPPPLLRPTDRRQSRRLHLPPFLSRTLLSSITPPFPLSPPPPKLQASQWDDAPWCTCFKIAFVAVIWLFLMFDFVWGGIRSSCSLCFGCCLLSVASDSDLRSVVIVSFIFNTHGRRSP